MLYKCKKCKDYWAKTERGLSAHRWQCKGKKSAKTTILGTKKRSDPERALKSQENKMTIPQAGLDTGLSPVPGLFPMFDLPGPMELTEQNSLGMESELMVCFDF